MLQLILRTLQAAHFENPPTDPIQPIPRPYQNNLEKPKQKSVPLSELANFLES